MRLSSVRIINFRSIKDATISFTPRCRILVGMNESGKSNILAALSLLDESKKIEDSDIREVGKGEDPVTQALVRFIFKISDEDRNEIFNRMRRDFLAEDDNTPIIKQSNKSLTLRDFINQKSEILFNAVLIGKKQILERLDIRQNLYANRWIRNG